MRKEKSLKNVVTSIFPYFVLTFLGFLRLKIMLNSLGDEIYALNQVFIQIFSYITLVEAGVGTLVTQMYYKYFVKNDKDKICKIYSYSRQLLKKISFIMILCGIVVSFCLKILTKNSLSLYYMQFVFLLYLFKSVLEYLMYAPRFVIMADQKLYKINLSTNIFKIVEMIIEIILLTIYKNYIIILLITIIIRYITYFVSNKIVFKEYPWLKNKKSNIKLEKKELGSVMAHKLAGTVYSNTDILLASSFLKPIVVVIYSSYNYIIKFINDIIYMVATGITASMGNVLYKDNKENQYRIFERINSIFMFSAMFFTIMLFLSTNKFVGLWLGKNKIMDILPFSLMIASLFLSIMNRPFLIVRDSKALYTNTKAIAITEAIINFILSIVLVTKFGLTGLVLGTIISSVFTSMILYPIYIYKNIFNISSINYFIKLIILLILTIIICIFTTNILHLYFGNNYMTWFIFSVLYAIVIFVLLVFINILFNKYFKETCYDIYNSLKEKFKNEKSI